MPVGRPPTIRISWFAEPQSKIIKGKLYIYIKTGFPLRLYAMFLISVSITLWGRSVQLIKVTIVNNS